LFRGLMKGEFEKMKAEMKASVKESNNSTG